MSEAIVPHLTGGGFFVLGKKPAAKPVVKPSAKPVKKPEDEHKPSADHADSWTWVEKEGLMNGKWPHEPLTREQFATVLKKLSNKWV